MYEKVMNIALLQQPISFFPGFLYNKFFTMKKKSYYLYLLFILVLCLTIPGCRQDREKPQSEGGPAVGSNADHKVARLLDALRMYRFNDVREAPPFELRSITGETVNLRQYRGKVVLLSFWATW
jgi:hypothetical protein